MKDIQLLREEQSRELHPANDLVLFALGQIYRYGEFPIVRDAGPAYQVPVRRHITTLQDQVPHDVRHVSDPTLRQWITQSLIKRFAVHDHDEVCGEGITAVSETDPAMIAAMTQNGSPNWHAQTAYRVFEIAVTLHEYGRPELFQPFIEDVRSKVELSPLNNGPVDRSAAGVIRFQTTVSDCLTQPACLSGIATDSRVQNLITTATQTMRYFYDSIENLNATPDFLGAYAKTKEKHDGTRTALDIDTRKLNDGVDAGGHYSDLVPDLPPRFPKRYETTLGDLTALAAEADDPDLRAAYNTMVDTVTRTVLTTSRELFARGPKNIVYQDKVYKSDDIVMFYTDTLKQKIITLPPGQRLLDVYALKVS